MSEEVKLRGKQRDRERIEEAERGEVRKSPSPLPATRVLITPEHSPKTL